MLEPKVLEPFASSISVTYICESLHKWHVAKHNSTLTRGVDGLKIGSAA